MMMMMMMMMMNHDVGSGEMALVHSLFLAV